MADFLRMAQEQHLFIPIFIGGVAMLFILALMVVYMPEREPPPPLPRGVMRLNVVIDPISTQIMISVILLVASLYVILSKEYDPADTHWAYGTVGTLIGFWLRPQRARSQSKQSKGEWEAGKNQIRTLPKCEFTEAFFPALSEMAKPVERYHRTLIGRSPVARLSLCGQLGRTSVTEAIGTPLTRMLILR